MTFDIFQAASKDTIRVGYISTDRGLVDNVSICEANEYAQKNPGTQFIFKTRNFVKFLNINEVNKLEVSDIVSTGSSCEGIVLEKDCGPAKAYFYGGGGVGVQGNPIIGQDGSVLAVDLVSGGFGYQYPPLAEVKDNCGIGAGAVIRTVLGEITETVEIYDGIEDFEDYELCEPTDLGYGRIYDPDGKDLGKWDPTIYANLQKDPIRLEIERYQKFIQQLSNPWWTSRKFTPLRVTSATKSTRNKFDVSFPVWNEFLNTYGISPVSPSSVPGTDFASDYFVIEWEEYFPYTGEYVFRGTADGAIKDLYLDNEKIATLSYFEQPVTVLKKTIEEGIHRIRVDLKNGGILKSPSQPLAPSQSLAPSQKINVNFNITTRARNLNGVRIRELDIYEVRKYKVNSKLDREVEIGKVYEVEVFSRNSKRVRLRSTNNGSILETEDSKDKDFDDLVVIASSGRFFGFKNGSKSATCKFVVDEPPSANRLPALSSLEKSIFNTLDFIDKADRKLWRVDPTVGKDSAFINQYGILPFNRNSERAQTDSFSGKHIINWEYVDFPVDGNYTIDIMVDDNVTIFIGNKDGQGQAGIGNGLRDINLGGDEIIINKNGFTSSGSSTGKSSETRFIKAGRYRIRAELDQTNVGPLGTVNPMGLAIDIRTAGSIEGDFVPLSWQQNPMGVSLTIEAPLPPIPQEPIVQQEGRCPNNPIWSTRFPNADQKWWPVRHPSWSKFLNRYAISPLPPLNTPSSDGGGTLFKNSWQVDIPYDGFYKFAVERDDNAKIYLDGTLVFDSESSVDDIGRDFSVLTKFKKIFITKGLREIEVEVENKKTEVYSIIDKKIFSTDDWLTQTNQLIERPPGSIFLREGNDYYMYVGGNDLVQIDFKFDWAGSQIAVTKVTIDTENGPLVFSRTKSGNAFTYNGSSSKSGVFKTENKYRVTFENKATSADVNNRNRSVIPPRIVDTGPLPSQKQQALIFQDPNNALDPSEDASFLAASATQLSPAKFLQQTVQEKNGVTYEGPPLASYVSGLLSPAFSDLNPPAEEIQGKTWVMRWRNIDFFEDGQYEIRLSTDDESIVRIDGQQIAVAKVGQGEKLFFYNASAGKKTLEVQLSNIRIPGTGFAQNPTYVKLKITKKVSVATGVSKSWYDNPMGVSAILIPPPCPKRVRGKGVVTDVIVDDPGNGYPIPTGNADPTQTEYPVSLRLKSVIVTDPGINYSPTDRIITEPDFGAVLRPVFDTFGRITEVIVDDPGFGITRYPEIKVAVGNTSTSPNNTGPGALRSPDVLAPDTGIPGVGADVGADVGVGVTTSPTFDIVTFIDLPGAIGVAVTAPAQVTPIITGTPLGESLTGVNASFVPQFEVIRDPIVIDPEKLIQVTDLVGLKQTGYVDGRPYYGSVFYKNGVRYAGFYETPGELVQVYDTLKESVDGEVITQPSAILRQGSDISSNDPRLNIPGSPENLI